MIKFDNEWDELLANEFTSEYYLKLREFLKYEYKNYNIYPNMYNIFNAIKHAPLSKIKVVIFGQDPYHGPGQAHGFCFSVQPGVQTPPSLLNIYKELRDDLGCYIPNNGYLMPWVDQGVMLLNTVLTVREGQANSHRHQGWETFTDHVIMHLNEREKPIIFLLWGRNAYEKEALITNKQHFILKAPHPSPLSASRGFFGCKHFSTTNKILTSLGETPIDWQIPNI